tara:strand:+ start:1414 stop:1557 length:144 start_codon:yes stop_codon:yes gene_type:complete
MKHLIIADERGAYTEAAKWSRLAADQGHLEAQLDLCLMTPMVNSSIA